MATRHKRRKFSGCVCEQIVYTVSSGAGLIDQAAFMRVECEDMAEDLRENGWTEPFRQSERLEPYDRARPIGQAYNSTNANYQKIIKQLTTLLPKPDTAPRQEDDGFGSFVRERDEA